MKALRRVLAGLYGLGVWLRNALYDRGFFAVKRARVPVLSVGSLEAGGAGKTPLVALLCDRLRAAGRVPAVLTRGYRGALERVGGEVHPGDAAARAGDEPLWLARRPGGVRVFAGRERVRMAEVAVRAGAQVLVLDDGFQHRRLGRDLDVVLVDGGREPAALALLPAGPLREPVRALGRAGLLVLRGDGPPPRAWRGPFVRVVDEALGLRVLPGGELLPLASLREREVSLCAGLARPERFAALVALVGARSVEERFFPDHHPFTASDLAGLRGELLTTEKDAVRLPPGVRALVLLHGLRVVEGEGLLDAALAGVVGVRP